MIILISIRIQSSTFFALILTGEWLGKNVCMIKSVYGRFRYVSISISHDFNLGNIMSCLMCNARLVIFSQNPLKISLSLFGSLEVFVLFLSAFFYISQNTKGLSDFSYFFSCTFIYDLILILWMLTLWRCKFCMEWSMT